MQILSETNDMPTEKGRSMSLMIGEFDYPFKKIKNQPVSNSMLVIYLWSEKVMQIKFLTTII